MKLSWWFPGIPLLIAGSFFIGCKFSEQEASLKSEADGTRSDFMCSTMPDFALSDLGDLKTGETQRKILCERENKNKVTSTFCRDNPPAITSLKSLQDALGLSPQSNQGNRGLFGGFFGGLFGGGLQSGSQFAFTAASSSLVGRFTSEINPRLLLFSTPNGQDPNMVAMGFVRGEQFVELVARDAQTSRLSFYLIKFTQSCNEQPGGCNKGDLLGPSIEKDWKEVTLYQDTDIENTILDCNQCHQPEGPQTTKFLRMQELRNPWTHFLSSTTGGGQQLLATFQKAHPNETFAGIPASMIPRSNPAQLEQFVRQNGFGNQPNEFPSASIEGGGGLGFFGFFRSRSANPRDVWSPLYERAVRGEVIPPPFYKLSVSDPEKLTKMTQAYLDLSSGRISKADFPDTRNIHPNQDLRDLQYMVKEGLAGQEIMIQACSQCHNSKLNQNISRARFNVDLTKISDEARETAIQRMMLACDDPKKMPPSRFKTLTNGEIQKVASFLRQGMKNPSAEPGSPAPENRSRTPPLNVDPQIPPESNRENIPKNSLSFETDIMPIISQSCSGSTCHSLNNESGNIEFIGDKKAFNSLNRDRIANGDMPPQRSSKQLSEKDRKTLLDYLDQ